MQTGERRQLHAAYSGLRTTAARMPMPRVQPRGCLERGRGHCDAAREAEILDYPDIVEAEFLEQAYPRPEEFGWSLALLDESDL